MRLYESRPRKQPTRLKQIGKYIFAITFVVTYLVHIIFLEHYELIASSSSHHDNGAPRNVTIINSNNGKYNHIHQTNSQSAYTNSHSPYHSMDPSLRISFRLHTPSKEYPYPDKFLSVKPYTCSSNDPNKADLPPSLSKRSVLNFTTTIATDLKIVHLGDSLGQQFVQGFDASVLSTTDLYSSHRKVLQEYFYEGKIYSHNCLSVAAPIRGGGISSYWRVTDLISRRNRRKDAKCAREELQQNIRVGWSMEQALELVGYNYSYYDGASNSTTTTATAGQISFPVGPFDAVIMRIPHGWMSIPDITRERLIEAIQLAHENLGVNTVIITTLPLNNNVLNEEDWRGIHEINNMIRDVARTWSQSTKVNEELSQGGGSRRKGVQWVLVQEFGEFTNQILWKNAQHLGYNTTAKQSPVQTNLEENNGWELTGTHFLLDRLPLPPRKWPPSIPMVCAQRPTSVTDKNCVRNKISTDGIHWCIESLGPRYAASVACLLGCVYNTIGSSSSNNNNKGLGGKSDEDVRQCEKECNEQFMSVSPVDENWILGKTTLFSS